MTDEERIVQLYKEMYSAMISKNRRELERRKRSFTLTPAGEYFYKKSLVLVADYDSILRELQQVSGVSREHLKVGLLKGCSGKEFNSAVSEFTVNYPDVTVEVTHGNHDALYALLRSGDAVQTTTKAVRLLRSGKPIIRRYCAFMKADNPSKHTSEFIEILKSQF